MVELWHSWKEPTALNHPLSWCWTWCSLCPHAALFAFFPSFSHTRCSSDHQLNASGLGAACPISTGMGKVPCRDVGFGHILPHEEAQLMGSITLA